MPLNINSTDGGKLDQSHFDAPYKIYKLQIRYLGVTGNITMPTTGIKPCPGRAASEIIRLHSAYGYKVVRFFAIREKKPPDLPSHTTDDPNEVLVYWDIEEEAPDLSTDLSNHIYQAAGVWVYALQTPVYPNDGIPMGKSPYDTTPAILNIQPASSFRKDLIQTPGLSKTCP